MIAQLIAFSLLNRAAGSQFFGFIPSSRWSRVAATGLMALAAGNIILFPLLLLWRTIAGSKNAGSALHGWATEGWLAGKLSFIPESRARGCVLMGIKHLAIIPAAYIGGGMWFLIPFIPLIYYAIGMYVKDDRALGFCELIIGTMVCLIVGIA